MTVAPAHAPANSAPVRAERAPTACPARRRFDPVRIWLACFGLVCVGLGAVGVVVPGLPTTIFLIIASWCFARSCPWLERRLIRNRFFAPFIRFLEPGAAMPTRARVISTVLLLGAVVPSVIVLARRDLPLAVPVVVAIAGVVGLVCIWAVARGKPVLDNV